MISTENKLNIAAAVSGAVGLGTLALTNFAPHEWIFHQNQTAFNATGIGFLLLASGLLYAKRILPPTYKGRPPGMLMHPDEKGLQAGRTHDRQWARRRLGQR